VSGAPPPLFVLPSHQSSVPRTAMKSPETITFQTAIVWTAIPAHRWHLDDLFAQLAIGVDQTPMHQQSFAVDFEVIPAGCNRVCNFEYNGHLHTWYRRAHG
jgi:hypothetical protein